jgi:competence protein ComEC
MNRNGWIVICLAYLAGLLATEIFAFTEDIIAWYWVVVIALGFCGLGVFGYFIIPKFYYRVKGLVWLLAGIVAGVAIVYFWWQIPQPQIDDISRILTTENSQSVTVSGRVIESPRLTRNNRIQFWLKADRVWDDNRKIKPVTGKLYVTIPPLKNIEIYPDLSLSVKGTLYRPTTPRNSHSFNFKYYLRQQGAFAGLQGKEVYLVGKQEKPWLSWWQVRQRIVASQREFLGTPKGELLSSMVLGSKAVDLSYDLRDRFTMVGLAHVFAASGFQVSLLLELVLKLTKNYSSKSQLIIGLIVLFSYLCLTGIQPSIARATVMGIGVLIAMVSDRKIRPLGALLVAAILLLLVNPIWIWDLGFQLSFLATLGLIVTVPYLIQKMDWLPPTIADLIAIPLAAFFWTTPLLMYVFKTISFICIPVNIVSAPLVTLISLGGMVSAAFGVIIPVVGSSIAYLFYYPIELFIWIVNWFASLPYSHFAVGQISLITLMIIYILFVVVWTVIFWQKRWLLVVLFSCCLIFMPAIYRYFNLQQMTVLTDDRQPIIIIQDRGNIGLIAGGNETTARYTILPFLTSEGINKIDYGITLNSQPDNRKMWSYIGDNLTVKKIFSNDTSELENSEKIGRDRTLSIGAVIIKLLDDRIDLLYLQIANQKCLLLSDIKDYISLNNFTLPTDTILLFNAKIANSSIAAIKPKTVIDTTTKVSKKLQQNLLQQSIELLSIDGDKALQWLPELGWQAVSESNNSL